MIGAARQEIADALAPIGVTVHQVIPATITPPCITVLPGSPWLEHRNLTRWDVACHVNAAAGTDAQTHLEGLVEQVRALLWGVGMAPGDTFQPASEAGLLSASTEVTVRVNAR